MTSNRACISCPPVYLPPSRSKNGFFTQFQKHKVLRQARFFRWLRFHHSRSRARFPGWQPGETGHGNGFGVYRPHRQRFPVGNRVTLVFLGFSAPSTAGCRVVDRSVVSAPLLSWKPAACLPPFLMSKIGAVPCRPAVDVILSYLAI